MQRLPRTLFRGNSHNAFLADASYWEKFHKGKSRFDWFDLEEDVALGKIAAAANSPKHILHLGCGTSSWCERLHNAFPEAWVTHLDASPEAVEVIRARLVREELGLVVLGDARSLPFHDESFDCIIEKGMLMINAKQQKSKLHAKPLPSVRLTGAVRKRLHE